MDSESVMLEACQNIYSNYLHENDSSADHRQVIHEIDLMLHEIDSVISEKSENGDNTILLEKIRTDFLYMRNDIKEG